MVNITDSKIVGAGMKAGRWLAAVMFFSALTGCPALQMKQVWEDDTYGGGRPKKVLVLCHMTVPTVRRAFENEFVKYLKADGMQSVESFRNFPEGVPSDDTGREAVVAQIREQGFDAVLFTRAIKGRTEVREIPGMTIVTGFGYSPYGYGGGVGVAATIGGPSQPTTQGYSHEQRLWASRSELRVSGEPREHIKPYAAMVTDQLAHAKIFK
jgi:hypothetical protein